MHSGINRHFTLYFALLVAVMICGAAGALAGESDHQNSVGIEFVPIQPGTFLMGGDDTYKYKDVTPAHEVTITKPFHLSKYEITRKQWAEVMGDDVGKVKKGDCPKDNVTYEDVKLFLLKLNALEGVDAYRLPTEAEWEYAARAGSSSKYFFGDDDGALDQYAWSYANAGAIKPVGELKPNPWGLYDIYGNVYEWCQDAYGNTYYEESPAQDPQGPAVDPKAKKAPARVIRGGGWYSKTYECNSAYRNNSSSSQKFIGFRIVKDIQQAPPPAELPAEQEVSAEQAAPADQAASAEQTPPAEQ